MTAMWSMTVLLGDAEGGLSALQESNNVVLVLLLFFVTLITGILIGVTYMVNRYNRKDRLPSRRLPRERDSACRERRSRLVALTAPSRWLAIKSANPQAVQEALGLQKPKPCSWEEGLSAAHEQKLFITPPVAGWILVIGANLPEPGDDVDKAFRFLLDLSRKLGHVQFFSVNRAVNHHAWVQADMGVVLRAYAWAGRTLWNQGKPTRAETDLALKCHAYGEGEDRIDFGRVDPAAVNTERVPLLAARWSLDPAGIDARMLKQDRGIAGQLFRPRAR